MAAVGKRGHAVQQHCNFPLGLFSVGKKGQISIEFILIVTIALIYINMSVWPTIEASSQMATEVKAVADTKIAATKLANALNEATISSGDMKKTIGLYLPEGAEITCEAGASKIDYTINVYYLNDAVSGARRAPSGDYCSTPLMNDLGTDQIGWVCASSIGLLGPLQQGCDAGTVGGSMQGSIYGEMVVERSINPVSGLPEISFKWK